MWKKTWHCSLSIRSEFGSHIYQICKCKNADGTEEWKTQIIYLQSEHSFPGYLLVAAFILATIQQPIKVWLANFAAVSCLSFFFSSLHQSPHRIRCCASSQRISGSQSEYQECIGKCLWTVAIANAHNNNSHGEENLLTTHRSQLLVVVKALLFMWFRYCRHWHSLTHRETNGAKDNNNDSAQIHEVEKDGSKAQKKCFRFHFYRFSFSATMETSHYYMFFFPSWRLSSEIKMTLYQCRYSRQR